MSEGATNLIKGSGVLLLIISCSVTPIIVGEYLEELDFEQVWLGRLAAVVVFWGTPIFISFKLSNRRDAKKAQRERTEGEQKAWQKDFEYEQWCNLQTQEERILQPLCDAILREHDWEGLPRIKVKLAPHIEDKTDRVAQYKGGFRQYRDSKYREVGTPVIEIKPSYFQRAGAAKIASTIKHELVHAWQDWKQTCTYCSEPHCAVFIRKGKEVGLDVSCYE